MRLTLHSDYAIRVLIYLAAHPDRLISTIQISEAYGISWNHLVRVVQTLNHAGFVNVTRGRGGGMILAKAPADIRIGDVIQQTEGDFHMVECFDMEHNTCPIVPVCGIQRVLAEATKAFIDTLNRYTLSDVARNPGRFTTYFHKSGNPKAVAGS